MLCVLEIGISLSSIVRVLRRRCGICGIIFSVGLFEGLSINLIVLFRSVLWNLIVSMSVCEDQQSISSNLWITPPKKLFLFSSTL